MKYIPKRWEVIKMQSAKQIIGGSRHRTASAKEIIVGRSRSSGGSNPIGNYKIGRKTKSSSIRKVLG